MNRILSSLFLSIGVGSFMLSSASATEESRLAREELSAFNIGMAQYQEQLVMSARNGSVQRMNLLLTAGADINIPDSEGNTALCAALKSQNTEAVRVALEAGANVHAKDASGTTPLHIAVSLGEMALVQTLLNKGAKAGTLDDAGKTPMMLASEVNRPDILRVLMESGSEANATSANLALLKKAVSSDNIELVKLLLETDSDLLQKLSGSGNGSDLLSLAQSESMQTLLKQSGCLRSISTHEAMRLLERYEIVDEYADAQTDYGLKYDEYFGFHFGEISDYSWRNTSKKILYNYMLYRDGQKKITDYDYLTAIYFCWEAGGRKKHLPEECLIAFIHEGASLNGVMARAVKHGHNAVVNTILSLPDINLSQYYSLSEAVRNNRADIVNALLPIPGIDVNQATQDGETPLYWAAANGNAKLAQTLLAVQGIDVNKSTPLYYAAVNGHAEVLSLLLSTPGIDVNKDSTGGTPLYGAVSNGRTQIVKALLAVPGIDVNQGTPLYEASTKGRVEIVNLLLGAPGINVNMATAKGTSLHVAAVNGNVDVVKALLAAPGIDLNMGCDTESPLFAAARKGHAEVVRLLLEAGADASYVNPKGESSASIATREGYTEIARMIAATGRDATEASLMRAIANNDDAMVKSILDAANGKAFSCISTQPVLDTAVSHGNAAMVKLLIAAGANPAVSSDDSITDGSNTPLYKAIEQGKTEIALMLIQAGAPLHAKDEQNELTSPPLTLAMEKSNLKVFKALVRAKAHQKIRWYPVRESFLHYLIYHEKYKLAKAYLSTGASVRVKDKMGRTPLVYAVLNRDALSAALLIQRGASPHVHMSRDAFYEDLGSMGSNKLPDDIKECSLLHVAAATGHVDIVRILLDAGADPCAVARRRVPPYRFYPYMLARSEDAETVLLKAYQKKSGKDD